MQIKKTDKEHISQKIAKRFQLDKTSADTVTEYVIAALHGDEEKLFYKVSYYIHFNNNLSFSNDVLLFAFETYVFLTGQSKNTQEKEHLDYLFYNFFKKVYSQKHIETKKLEKRSETVQGVLQHMTVRLNKRLDTQKLMIANISHEMRTSLNAIVGYITLINEKNVLSGEDKAYLEKAGSATSALQALVSDILDISKINSGQMEIKKGIFWLDETILHSLDNVMMMANKKNLESLMNRALGNGTTF